VALGLEHKGFPRCSQYDADWQIEGGFGGNPLWLAEWLCRDIDLVPGMRVLDLGCGRANSSVFLAREFGVEVWATDLWISEKENLNRIAEAGMANQITAVNADARALPFEHNFFDAVLGFDSFQYFATDQLFLPYILQFLKPQGRLGFASAGMMQEFEDAVPQHLKRFWGSDAWCLQTANWWRKHWERPSLVDVTLAEPMNDGIALWLQWAQATDCSDWYLETLERDAGQYLGYIRLLATKRDDAPSLTYDLRTGTMH